MQRFSEEVLEKCMELLRGWHIPLEEVRELCNMYSPIIKLNREEKLHYPEGMTPLTPHLEQDGPLEFDITKLETWFIPEQEEAFPKAETYYESVKENTLERCLGLRELIEIQKRGYLFFTNHFSQSGVYAYKATARDADGRLCFPCLGRVDGRRCKDGKDNVVISWWNSEVQIANMPVYRFP